MFYVTPDRNLFTWLSFVAVGPLYVFGLHKPNHDFRRFPRPAELNTMLQHAGFELLPRRGRPTTPAMVGLEYRVWDESVSGQEVGAHSRPRRRDLQAHQPQVVVAERLHW